MELRPELHPVFRTLDRYIIRQFLGTFFFILVIIMLIAVVFDISEKTVRNHTSNLFDKLGVWSRAQAIVFARDHGFRD